MEKKQTWISKNMWVIPLALGILAFVGLALPLVQAHTVSDPHYNYSTYAWDCTEGKRVGFGAGMLFGLEGAVPWPYFILYGLLLAGVILIVIGAFKREKANILISIAMFFFLISGVLFFLSNFLYGFFNAKATVDAAMATEQSNPDFVAYYSDNYNAYIKGYVALADGRLGAGALLSGALAALASFSAFTFVISSDRVDIRSMTEIAMLCAIAIVLDVVFHYIPHIIPNQVGSISIALVPIYLIALRHGPAKGFLAASFIYGLVTCFTDGYGLWLYPLDYFVGYSGTAIIGFFTPLIMGKDQKTYNVKGIIFIFVGCLLGGIVRYIGSAASSIVNYAFSLPAALLVNLYAIISALLCAVVLAALYGPLLRLNRHFPVRRTLKDGEE